MSSDELDDLILAHLDGGGVPGRLEQALVDDPAAGIRLAELALQEDLLSELGDGRVAEPVRSSFGALKLISFAAAALLVVLLLVLATRQVNLPAPVAVTPLLPPPAKSLRETPSSAPSGGGATEGKPAPVESPKEEPPAPPKAPEPKPVVREAPPKEEPKPVPAPDPPPRSTPDPVVYNPVAVASVNGAAWRRRQGKTEAVKPAMELAKSDQVLTTHRRAAGVATSAGCTIWLERNTALSMEQRADGAARVTLASGTAFFSVDPRSSPFVVATPEGEVVVTGTSFQIERDEKRSFVSVLEGSVRLRNEKGEVLLKAGQRSAMRAGERPSAPAKADVEAAAAWRLRPELSDTREPFADHETGGRKYPGLVLAAPFFEGEAESGRLAKATAEGMDVGLALGHSFRDLPRKVWINVDRGMEAEVRGDGSLGPEAFSDRARKATADYLDHARQAAGVAPRQPLPMIVQFRNHYLNDLDVCEVASAGWDRRTIAGLKAVYAQLLEKHKPATRLEMRFQGVDDSYDYKGAKRAFSFAEADARIEGYMSPRNARCAAAFFLNPGFGRRDEDFEVYAKILAEMIEYLYLRRR